MAAFCGLERHFLQVCYLRLVLFEQRPTLSSLLSFCDTQKELMKYTTSTCFCGITFVPLVTTCIAWERAVALQSSLYKYGLGLSAMIGSDRRALGFIVGVPGMGKRALYQRY